MQTLKEPSNNITSFHEEFSNLLPFISKKPEIRKILEELGEKNQKDNIIEIKTKPKGISWNSLWYCYRPPYTFGVSFLPEHPYIINTTEQTDYTYNPVRLVDHMTGEISLAAVSGQNMNIFYKGKDYPILPNVNLGYYNQALGSIVQHVRLVPYSYDSLIEIKLDIGLPQDVTRAVEFFSDGDVLGEWRGLLGAQGFIDLKVGFHSIQNVPLYTTSTKFLDAWKTHDSEMNETYEFNPVCRLSFVLPAGESEFFVHIAARVSAHSDWPNDPLEAIADKRNWALIDFRGGQALTFNILNNFITTQDHQSAGAIKIKSICIGSEPYFAVLYPNPNRFE